MVTDDDQTRRDAVAATFTFRSGSTRLARSVGELDAAIVGAVGIMIEHELRRHAGQQEIRASVGHDGVWHCEHAAVVEALTRTFGPGYAPSTYEHAVSHGTLIARDVASAFPDAVYTEHPPPPMPAGAARDRSPPRF